MSILHMAQIYKNSQTISFVASDLICSPVIVYSTEPPHSTFNTDSAVI